MKHLARNIVKFLESSLRCAGSSVSGANAVCRSISDESTRTVTVQYSCNSSEIPECIVLNVAGASSLKILRCPAVKASNLIKYSFILQ